MPASGKTTIFNAVSGARGEVGAFHQGVDVNHAVAKVPDPRLEKLASLVNPQRIIPASIEYFDVPGVMADSGNDQYIRFLAALREADALAHVVRYFNDQASPHPLNSLDPPRDAAEVMNELALADLAVVENRLEKLAQAAKRGQRADEDAREETLLGKCKTLLEAGKPLTQLEALPKDFRALRNFSFLTLKPALFVLNVDEDMLGGQEAEEIAAMLGDSAITICGKLEMEIAELSAEERQEFIDGLGIGEPGCDRLARACYKMLGLASFFTVESGQLRAWTIAAGDDAVAAAGKVHSDMARGFIRAEVAHFSDLMELGSFKAAKEAGKMRLEGKDYKVRDGDIITFRFNV